MSMVEVKVTELSGAALDWAVGIADGRELELPSAVKGRKCLVWCDPFVIKREGHPDFHDKTRRNWEPSTNWSQGGPLIDKHRLEFVDFTNEYACVSGWCHDGPFEYYPDGETHLIAACRAIVTKASGDTVQVPEELMR